MERYHEIPQDNVQTHQQNIAEAMSGNTAVSVLFFSAFAAMEFVGPLQGLVAEGSGPTQVRNRVPRLRNGRITLSHLHILKHQIVSCILLYTEYTVYSFDCEEKVAVEKDLSFRLQRIKEIESGMPQKAGTCLPFFSCGGVSRRISKERMAMQLIHTYPPLKHHEE